MAKSGQLIAGQPMTRNGPEPIPGEPGSRDFKETSVKASTAEGVRVAPWNREGSRSQAPGNAAYNHEWAVGSGTHI